MPRSELSRRHLLRGLPAAVLLGTGMRPVAVAARPLPSALPLPLRGEEKDWHCTFQDDFSSPTLSDKWIRVQDAAEKLDTARRPENVQLGDGELRLKLERNKDPAGRHPWSAGYIRTRNFTQCYGYFECAMRLAPELGVNNAFWLYSDRSQEQDGRTFELDVAEAKFPNAVDVTSQLWRPERTHDTRRHRSQLPLSEGFYRYGMLWTERDIVFYLEDQEIFRTPNRWAHSPADLRLSNASGRFAGPNDGDIAGASTRFGWVRVFARRA